MCDETWCLFFFIALYIRHCVYSTIKVEAISFDEMKWKKKREKMYATHIWGKRFLREFFFFFYFIFNTTLSRYGNAYGPGSLAYRQPAVYLGLNRVLRATLYYLFRRYHCVMQYLLWLLFFIYIRWLDLVVRCVCAGIYMIVNCDDASLSPDTPPLPPLAPTSCCWLLLLLLCASSAIFFFLFHFSSSSTSPTSLLCFAFSFFSENLVRRLWFTATFLLYTSLDRSIFLAFTKYRKCNPSFFECDFDYIFNNNVNETNENRNKKWERKLKLIRNENETENVYTNLLHIEFLISSGSALFFIFIRRLQCMRHPRYAAGSNPIFSFHFFYDEK